MSKNSPKCPFLLGAHCPMKIPEVYFFHILENFWDLFLSAYPQRQGCYFENFTPKKGGIQITAASRKAIKNSRQNMCRQEPIFSIHRLIFCRWIFRNSPHFFVKTTSDVYNFGRIRHWRRVRSVNARCPWCRVANVRCGLWSVAGRLPNSQVPFGLKPELLCQKVQKTPENVAERRPWKLTTSFFQGNEKNRSQALNFQGIC